MGTKMRAANHFAKTTLGAKDLQSYLLERTNAGVSEAELARLFKVNRLTIRNWKKVLHIVTSRRARINRA